MNKTQDILATSLQDSSFYLKKATDMTLKEKEELTETIANIAKGLALLLKDVDNKRILEKELKASTKKEHILEASEFLNQVFDITVNGRKQNTTFGGAIANTLPNSKGKKLRSKIVELPFGLIDILLPGNEYQNNWNANMDIQVAAVGWNEKIKDTEITIFTVDGKSFIYPDKKHKPKTTTLVVNASEKQGKYYNQSKKSNNNLKKINSYPYEFWTGGAYIDGWYDDWTDPEMEVYFKFRIKNNATNWNWTNWITQWQSGTQDCPQKEWKYFDVKVMGTGWYSYNLKLSMYDYDYWSPDDQIADGTIWKYPPPMSIDIPYFDNSGSMYSSPNVYSKIEHGKDRTFYKTQTN